MKKLKVDNFALFSIKLENGSALYVGSELYAIHQIEEKHATSQSLVLSIAELKALKTVEKHILQIDEGVAEYAGCGLWQVLQFDGASGTRHDAVLSLDDVEKLLAHAEALNAQGHALSLLAAAERHRNALKDQLG